MYKSLIRTASKLIRMMKRMKTKVEFRMMNFRLSATYSIIGTESVKPCI